MFFQQNLYLGIAYEIREAVAAQQQTIARHAGHSCHRLTCPTNGCVLISLSTGGPASPISSKFNDEYKACHRCF